MELQCYEASPLLYILTDVCPGCAHVCVHVCVCMNRYFYSSGTHLRVSSSNGLLRHYLHMQRQQETKEPTQCSWTERTKPELCEASFKRFSSSVGVTEPESHREGGDDTARWDLHLSVISNRAGCREDIFSKSLSQRSLSEGKFTSHR